MKILLIYSSQPDRAQIKRALNRAGNNNVLTETDSADAAENQIKHNKFDVILLDYFLPNRDGIEFIKAIKVTIGSYPTTLIVTSEKELEELIAPILKAGAHDFLPKAEITAARLKRTILESSIRRHLEIELQISQKGLKDLAEHDSLTGLPNRYMFDSVLNELLKPQKRSDGKIAVLLIDLDNFKYVNDHFGHHIGNQLLVRVTGRIKSCLRGHENLYRLGGDEFIIILKDLVDEFEASSVALRINRVLKKAFEFDNNTLTTSASIGIAISPNNSENPIELVQFADIAMYKAKQQGKGQTCFFDESMQESFIQRFELERDLRRAIERKEFELYYQPIFCNGSLALKGFEALIRWNNNGCMVPPDKFIPVAESCGVITELGRWIIQTAIQQLAKWHEISPEIAISINISAVQLNDSLLVDLISGWLSEAELNASLVTLELTETAFIETNAATIERLKALHKLGLSIALDDFGTGFSSLSHLLNFPIDTVKIDKSILPSNTENPKKLEKTIFQIFNGITNMLAALNHIIVAEGVETQDQLELCQTLPIELLQGYFLARPETAEAATMRLVSHNNLSDVQQA